MELYGSRVGEMRISHGPFLETSAAAVFARYLLGEGTDNLLELTYESRKRIHNLKYYTWVEQQGRTFEEIQQQWYAPEYWTDIQGQAGEIDEQIKAFNDLVGLE